MLADIKETFQRFRPINMKLNPKKCSFGIEEGLFLGYFITKQGIRANLSKVKAITDIEQPKILKDIQSLNGKLAALSQFLSKGAERSLPFFKVLKSSPIHGEVLVMYLAASTESINAALFAKREKGQAHTVAVLTNSSIKQALTKSKKSGRVAKWAIKPGEHDIVFQTRDDSNKEMPKDFLIDAPPEDNRKEVERKTDTKLEDMKLSCEWKLYTDGASSSDDLSVGLMLIDPKGKEYTYALRLNSKQRITKQSTKHC
ncbi:hypothetical protein Tco_0186406 [Tanacetum coccineum]